ncbi:uncharacterized protein LOC109817540 isoform X2 [Cajanus cajan]|uniref:uncharacterized protein LOC109817540 isoform X2 n=1 Tax=Cajanus cajan TaxID=3821 RepID=UPI00098DB5FF|nr:uncharacterized protein LOC109817540 isoform X2 [Cajanus cajan]
MLMSWLQSSLSPAILWRVLGSVHSYQVWDKIHDYFHKQTRARARQLRTELRSTLLEEKTMEEFLLRIKALVDALASVGESVSQQEHVDVILEGLSQDYSSVISVIESKFDTPSIEEVEALLLAHEMRTQKYKKKLLSESAAVNLTQVPNSNPNFQENGNVDNQVSHSSQGADVNMNGGRNAYRGRGRSGRYSGIQCQVCCKIGHIATNCYHRFDQNYQPIFTYNFQGNFSQNHENSFSGNVGQQSYVNQPQQFFSHNGSNNRWTQNNRPTSSQWNPNTRSTSQQPSAMVTNTNNAPNPTSWFPDSGASFHVTGDQQNIHHISPFEGPDQIFIGNGQGHQ